MIHGRRALPFLAVLAVLCVPETAAEHRFRLIAADSPERLERRLRSAAGDGFRVVDGAIGVTPDGKQRTHLLLEKGPGGTAEYVVIGGSGDLGGGTNRDEINARGAEGYRPRRETILTRTVVDYWLPPSAYDDQTIWILERVAPAKPYEYDAVSYGDETTFRKNLDQRHRDGYRILGLWNSGRKLQVVLERPLDAPTRDDAVLADSGRFRMLIRATGRVLKFRLNDAAEEGFRVLAAADPSVLGPPLLLLSRDAAPRLALEYDVVPKVARKARKGKLERKLRAKARQGWRVAPNGITRSFLVLERTSRKPPHTAYAVVSSRTSPDVPGALEDAAARGYRPLKLFVEPALTAVVLEKPAPDPGR